MEEQSSLLPTTRISRGYTSIHPPRVWKSGETALHMLGEVEGTHGNQKSFKEGFLTGTNRVSPCRPSTPGRAVFGIIATLLFAFSLLWAPKAPVGWISSTSKSVFVDAENQEVPPVIERSWGALSPFYSVEPYKQPPTDCKITQIQRHGARYPPLRASERIKTVIAKLQSASHYTDHRLDFLRSYTFSLGITELMAFGGIEAQLTGRTAYERYHDIISPEKPPFLRSSMARRVVESASNWTIGFSLASQGVYNPKVSVIIHESRHSNNTLDHRRCPNLGSAAEYVASWTNVFAPPIASRLNQQAPGAGITAVDISNLMAACALDTMHSLALSPICGLFTPAEFADYEYLADVEKYYNTGYGQPLGPVQGVGYINELIARLTATPVRDNTQTNRTLDSSPLTFPLNETFYADFSHGNQMIAIYAALGLFKQLQDLDTRKPNVTRTWVASRMTSFSTNMAVERLECKGHSEDRNSTHKIRKGTYVRISINDALQPLEFCGADGDGLCEMARFVESQGYARRDGDGDFEKCLE